MKIECPSCHKGFEMPDGVVPDTGAAFRCPACKTSFTAYSNGLTMLSTPASPTPGSGAPQPSQPAPGPSPFPSMAAPQGAAMQQSGSSSAYGRSPQPVAAPASVPELQPGETLLGQFEIKKVLGRGGFGTVYLAYDHTLCEEVALKTIPTFDKAADVVTALGVEYRGQRQISETKHILRIDRPQAAAHAGMDWVLLPMEVAQKNFRQWLNETSDDIKGRKEAGLSLFNQILRGVEAIHKAGLVHLDLKPENILLLKGANEKEWTVKIADFGLMRGLERGKALNPAMMRDGMGTPWYMAPEQVFAARQKEIGPAADIYALGIILIELLDGDVPYDGAP